MNAPQQQTMIPDSTVPESLFDQNGRPHYGIFSDTLPALGLERYVARSAMGKRLNSLRQHLAVKSFQFFGGISDELLFGCALADLRYMGVMFTYVFERKTGILTEHMLKLPAGMGLKMTDAPLTGTSTLQVLRNQVQMRYNDQPRTRQLNVSLPAKEILIAACMDETAASFQPMSLCTQAGSNGWVYANKVAGVRLTGSVRVGDRHYDLASLNACGHHDFSIGRMRRDTFWNWACLSGPDNSGNVLGLNVSCGVNETSYSENCFWVNGACFPVAGMRFDYDHDNLMHPWQIQSLDGRIKLCFQPEGRHHEYLDVLLLASNFSQLFGVFSGELTDPNGRVYTVDGLCGFVEEQFARW